MDSEGGLIGSIGPGKLAPFLLAGSAILVLLSLFVGWFSVDSRFEAWDYDPAASDGKGRARQELRLTIDTELKMLSMDTSITPKPIEEFLTADGEVGMPTYDEHAPRSGSQFLGLFLIAFVELVALVAAVGFYFWNLKSNRSFVRTIWKLSGLYGGLMLFAMGHLIFAVPQAAEDDVRDILSEYHDAIQALAPPGTFVNIKSKFPEMLEPNVSFVWTWTCCPVDPDDPTKAASTFPDPDGSGQILVLMTTTSRPSAGFWLQTVGLVSFFGGLALAARARQLSDRGTFESGPPLAPSALLPGPPR